MIITIFCKRHCQVFWKHLQHFETQYNFLQQLFSNAKSFGRGFSFTYFYHKLFATPNVYGWFSFCAYGIPCVYWSMAALMYLDLSFFNPFVPFSLLITSLTAPLTTSKSSAAYDRWLRYFRHSSSVDCVLLWNPSRCNGKRFSSIFCCLPWWNRRPTDIIVFLICR